MSAILPWQYGNIFGPKVALAAKGEVVGKMMKAAKKPVIIVGAQALEENVGDRVLLDYVVELSKNAGIPLVATAHTLKPLLERGFNPAAIMGVVEVTDRLRDPNWSLDGKGSHDLAVLVGIRYELESQMLSTIKHFATHMKTISLDRYFHPNADWSFPNLKEKDWAENLNKLMEVFKPS